MPRRSPPGRIQGSRIDHILLDLVYHAVQLERSSNRRQGLQQNNSFDSLTGELCNQRLPVFHPTRNRTPVTSEADKQFTAVITTRRSSS